MLLQIQYKYSCCKDDQHGPLQHQSNVKNTRTAVMMISTGTMKTIVARKLHSGYALFFLLLRITFYMAKRIALFLWCHKARYWRGLPRNFPLT